MSSIERRRPVLSVLIDVMLVVVAGLFLYTMSGCTAAQKQRVKCVASCVALKAVDCLRECKEEPVSPTASRSKPQTAQKPTSKPTSRPTKK